MVLVEAEKDKTEVCLSLPQQNLNNYNKRFYRAKGKRANVLPLVKFVSTVDERLAKELTLLYERVGDLATFEQKK